MDTNKSDNMFRCDMFSSYINGDKVKNTKDNMYKYLENEDICFCHEDVNSSESFLPVYGKSTGVPSMNIYEFSIIKRDTFYTENRSEIESLNNFNIRLKTFEMAIKKKYINARHALYLGSLAVEGFYFSLRDNGVYCHFCSSSVSLKDCELEINHLHDYLKYADICLFYRSLFAEENPEEIKSLCSPQYFIYCSRTTSFDAIKEIYSLVEISEMAVSGFFLLESTVFQISCFCCGLVAGDKIIIDKCLSGDLDFSLIEYHAYLSYKSKNMCRLVTSAKSIEFFKSSYLKVSEELKVLSDDTSEYPIPESNISDVILDGPKDKSLPFDKFREELIGAVGGNLKRDVFGIGICENTFLSSIAISKGTARIFEKELIKPFEGCITYSRCDSEGLDEYFWKNRHYNNFKKDRINYIFSHFYYDNKDSIITSSNSGHLSIEKLSMYKFSNIRSKTDFPENNTEILKVSNYCTRLKTFEIAIKRSFFNNIDFGNFDDLRLYVALLATEGFYFSLRNNSVYCFNCKVKMPYSKRKMFMVHCILKRDNVCNFYRNKCSSILKYLIDDSIDGFIDVAHPGYFVRENRKNSWKKSKLRFKKEDIGTIIESGFFLSGGGNKFELTCFCCDLKIINKESIDACLGGEKIEVDELHACLSYSKEDKLKKFNLPINSIGLCRLIMESRGKEFFSMSYNKLCDVFSNEISIFLDVKNDGKNSLKKVSSKFKDCVMKLGYGEDEFIRAINEMNSLEVCRYSVESITEVIKNISARDISSYYIPKYIEQNRELKKILYCIKCKKNKINMLFLPCAHHIFCYECSMLFIPKVSSGNKECDQCGEKILGFMKTYTV